MSRSTVLLIVAVVAVFAIAALPAVADTWDAFAQFSQTANPNGAWSYGFSTDTQVGTAFTNYSFTLYTGCDNSFAAAPYYRAGTQKSWRPDGSLPAYANQLSLTANIGGADWIFQANKIWLMPQAVSGTGGAKSIARWTAPADGTYYVKGWFKACSDHGSAYTLIQNRNTFLFRGSGYSGDPIKGANNLAESYYGAVSLNSGDTLDFVANRDSGYDGWSWSGATNAVALITTENYLVNGTVSDANGNPIGGTRVGVVGGEDYAMTDSSGHYALLLTSGSYTVRASHSAYTDTDQAVSVTGPGHADVNFSMPTTGVWDLYADYTYAIAANNGPWTYGWAQDTWPSAFVGYSLVPYTHGLTGVLYKCWNWDTSLPSNAPPYIVKNYNTAAAWLIPAQSVAIVGKHDNSQSIFKKSVVRFTAPAAGYYNYSGQFTNLDGSNHDADWAITYNGNHVVGAARFTGAADQMNVPFSGLVNLAAGGTIDFAAGDGNSYPDQEYEHVKLALVVKAGAPAITGYVEDANHNRLAGAAVRNTGGTESTTTDSAGNFTIVLPGSGSYTIAASKAGFDAQSATVSIDGVNIGSQNFTLPLGAVISGTIYDNIPAHPAIGQVAVTTMDGVYATTADSAGYYSVRVTHGVVSVRYYKFGYAVKVISVDASSGASVVNDVYLDQGWDLAADFTSQNPRAPWSLGYVNSTAYSQTGYTPFGAGGYGGWWCNTYDQWWHATTTQLPPYGDPYNQSPSFVKNIWYTPASTASGPYTFYREGLSVAACGNSGNTVLGVARFVAPTSAYFKIAAKFAGITTAGGTNTNKVGLLLNGDEIYSGQLNGFVGRAVNNFTDSSGTAPVLTYADNRDLVMGDVLDLVIYDGNGYLRPDLTVSLDQTSITGRVTCPNLPGNPPVVGAKIDLNGWVKGSTYSTLTDANGYYLISVKDDTYDVDLVKADYNTPLPVVIAVPVGTRVTHDFTMDHSDRWDLVNDFSTVVNPCGQWSYGSVDTDTNAFTLYTAYYTNYPSAVTPIPVWGREGQPPIGGAGSGPCNAWYGRVGKNVSSDPIDWGSDYVKPGEVYFFGGGYQQCWPVIRWTSPDSRVIKVNYTVKNIYSQEYVTAPVSLVKNNSVMVTKTAAGFEGRSANGYTDSIGPFIITTYETNLPVSAGDTLDFALGQKQYPYGFGSGFRALTLWATISAGSGTMVNSVSQIKALNAGDSFFMMTPVTLCCSTNGAWGFDKKYGGGTENAFYVESDDRTQGLKCIGDPSLPTYSTNGTNSYKVTFAGTVAIDSLGQKIVQIQTILGASAATAPRLLGKGSKAMTNSNTLVKVWGKITQMVANTGSDNGNYTYEYIVINDGGQDIKIPMHCQFNWMVTSDPIIGGLKIGHYIAVTGIAGTTTGSDAAVYPRNVFDIVDYTPDIP